MSDETCPPAAESPGGEGATGQPFLAAARTGVAPSGPETGAPGRSSSRSTTEDRVDRCLAENPDSPDDCTHHCDLPVGHEGQHESRVWWNDPDA